jgi:hypothetical protein
MTLMICRIPLFLLILTAWVWSGEPPQTGHLQLTFKERSPLGQPAELARRTGWRVDLMQKQAVVPDYDIAGETFEVWVPQEYDGKKPFGLFVWVSPSPSGKPMERWLDVLGRRHLIWVGANNSGNSRKSTERLSLAVDAVVNMKSRFAIDESRVYVSGASGGGRVSSMLGVTYPDVFRGGFYLIGCDYFREIPTGEPNRFWPRSYVQPAGKLMLQARRNGHVLLTGETDMNRPQTKANFELGFTKDGFEHVLYLEVPGMGHQPPDAQWFEKGIDFLDRSAKDAQLAASQPAASQPVAAGDEEAVAQRQLRAARLYLDSGRTAEGRRRLRQIVTDHPHTPAAAEARRQLTETEAK